MAIYLSALSVIASVGATRSSFSELSLGQIPFYAPPQTCRTLPGDAAWPSLDEWAAFNETVGGRLIAAIPSASVCHDPNFDAVECAHLKERWDFPQMHTEHPSAVMMPWFQECHPYGPQSKPCTLGDLVSFSVNISSVQDVVTSLQFVKDRNIRLAIKNTGHDFLGKNTGKGALGLWTHHLNIIDVMMNYSTGFYSGPAMKLGAGVQASAALQAAAGVNHRILSGTCPTVGLAGGYTQGGGHSILTSRYGMAADNVLEWEVVTPSGEHIVTSQEAHPDLHWAISGGGGGTFGVVISMTIKMHPEGPVGGALFRFDAASRSDEYYSAVGAFQASLGYLVDNGGTTWYLITNSAFTAIVTGPDLSAQDIRRFLKSTIDILDDHDMRYTLSLTEDPSYFDHFVRYYGPLPDGIWETSHLIGSRLIPRKVIAENNTAVINTFRDILVDDSWQIAGLAVNASYSLSGTTPGHNAVHPSWRDALAHVFTYSVWDWSVPVSAMQDREAYLTNKIEPELRSLTPDSGSYLNEANFAQVDWQEAFYGSNYDRLLAIKRKYDPDHVLYAPTAVGSEAWLVADDGRLCRA